MLFQNDETDPYFDSIKEIEVILTHLIDDINRKGFAIFENEFKKEMKDFK